ncbi:hypothetical protein ACFO5K_21295 [Nocardia halotolerans]|uniref:Uncharacterized protein n=1 Tax=Nocardia halotolerans TaxID=1755878 RepID=A0ABV8VKN5_9NOCA
MSAISRLSAVYERRPAPETVEWKLDMLEQQIDLAVGATLTVLLGLGGALILARRAHGLTMVTIGAGLATFALWGAAAMSTSSGTVLTCVFYSLGPIGALIASLLPSSRRWVESGKNPQLTPSNSPRPAVAPYN